MNEQKISMFKKYRYIFSIIFALIISGVFMFLAVQYINSIDYMSFSPIPGLIFYFLLFVIFAVSRSIIYSILSPITPEEKAQSEIVNINSKKFLKWFLIVISIISICYFLFQIVVYNK